MPKPGPKPRQRCEFVRVEIRCTPVERAEIHAAAIVSDERSTNAWALPILLEAAREQRAEFIAKHGKRSYDKVMKGVSE